MEAALSKLVIGAAMLTGIYNAMLSLIISTGLTWTVSKNKWAVTICLTGMVLVYRKPASQHASQPTSQPASQPTNK